MADLIVTSTGKRVYQVDNAVAALLREAFPDSFTEIAKLKPSPPSNKWSYFCGLTAGGVYAVQRKRGSGEIEFVPTSFPEKVQAAWPECPQSVISQFAATRVDSRAGIIEGIRS